TGCSTPFMPRGETRGTTCRSGSPSYCEWPPGSGAWPRSIASDLAITGERADGEPADRRRSQGRIDRVRSFRDRNWHGACSEQKFSNRTIDYRLELTEDDHGQQEPGESEEPCNSPAPLEYRPARSRAATIERPRPEGPSTAGRPQCPGAGPHL